MNWQPEEKRPRGKPKKKTLDRCGKTRSRKTGSNKLGRVGPGTWKLESIDRVIQTYRVMKPYEDDDDIVACFNVFDFRAYFQII